METNETKILIKRIGIDAFGNEDISGINLTYFIYFPRLLVSNVQHQGVIVSARTACQKKKKKDTT